jgi:hypothetical protein
VPGEQEIRPAKAAWPLAGAPARWLWLALGVLAASPPFVALRKFLTTPRTFLHLPPPCRRTKSRSTLSPRCGPRAGSRRCGSSRSTRTVVHRPPLSRRPLRPARARTHDRGIHPRRRDLQKLSDAHRDLVAGFLEQSDLVKFARHAPARPTCATLGFRRTPRPRTSPPPQAIHLKRQAERNRHEYARASVLAFACFLMPLLAGAAGPDFSQTVRDFSADRYK